MGERSAPYRAGRPTAPELSAGVAVLHPSQDRVLLLHEIAEGRWSLPKGHVDPGESLATAALRELREETGLRRVALGIEVAVVHYRFFDRKHQRNVYKSAVYFVGRARSAEVRLEPIFDRSEWVGFTTALRRVRFATDRLVLRAAQRCLRAGRVPRPSR